MEFIQGGRSAVAPSHVIEQQYDVTSLACLFHLATTYRRYRTLIICRSLVKRPTESAVSDLTQHENGRDSSMSNVLK